MTWTVKMADARYDGYEEGFDEGFTAGREDGLQQGIEQGLERGAYQNKLETAHKLLLRGYSPEDIADLSGLTISQIQEIQ